MAKEVKKDIQKMFRLANLEWDDEKSGKFVDNAVRVINYFEKLNKLDTSKVEPTAHAVEAESHLRNDSVCRFEESVKIMNEAPEVEGDFIRVPRVI